jgi:CRP-like cAMP-binding protein
MMVSTETLRFFPLFSGQSDYMLREITMLSREAMFNADEWIFKQDDPAFWLYIILEGSVSLAIVLHKNGSIPHIERMGTLVRGEVLGWSSIVPPYMYALSAQAVKNTRLIEIKAGGLRELLDDNPQFGYYFMKNITEVISERLKYKCIQILSLKI